MIAGGANRHGPIDIFPGGGAAQNIVHLLAFRVCLDALGFANGRGVGTSRTDKGVGGGSVGAFFAIDLEERAVQGTKKHGGRNPARVETRLLIEGFEKE